VVYNLETLLKQLLEEISADDRKKIETLQPNDILTVYHGIPLFRLPQLINGFDATADFKRDYRPGRHAGLFVTADFETAKSFGGGAVLELKVPAKLVHGTDYGGNIGREQERARGDDLFDWIKEKFPNSFRPYMTYTMLQTGEPQGLLRGIVKPSQITRIWVRNLKTGNWEDYSREEFIKKQSVYNVEYGQEKRFKEADINLANPNIKLADFVQAYAKAHSYDEPEKLIQAMIRWAKRDPEGLELKLSQMDIGGSTLGKRAIDNIQKQLTTLATNESVLPVTQFLDYLFESEEPLWQWFNPTSVPGTLYHGTTTKFVKFDPKKIGRRDSGNLGTGIYLTTDDSIAMRYAEDNVERFGGTPTVLAVKHSLNKVADFDKLMPYLETTLNIDFPPKADELTRSKKLQQWFLSNGYDAARGGHEVVVFKPEKLNIKGQADVPSSQERLKQLYKTHMQRLGK
jgi:hypothetical protein